MTTPSVSRDRASRGDRLDRRLERWGDRLNPILVKETRQVFKSRVFVWAFLLVVIGAWLLSVVQVLRLGEGVERGESGPLLFRDYYILLTFGLSLIVPAGAFRSLASEIDHNTLDMLSITRLTPRQIILGKLQTAVVHMAAYYSAIAPFMCFTYLLGGVGILTYAWAFLISFLASLGLCLGGLMLGAFSRSAFWHAVNRMLLAVASLVVFLIGLGLASLSSFDGGIALLTGLVCCLGYTCLLFSLVAFGVTVVQLTPASHRHPPPQEERDLWDHEPAVTSIPPERVSSHEVHGE